MHFCRSMTTKKANPAAPDPHELPRRPAQGVRGRHSDPRDAPEDEAPETPTDEPPPVPVQDPPVTEPRSPYTVTKQDIKG
jgi:hypothetical protein